MKKYIILFSLISTITILNACNDSSIDPNAIYYVPEEIDVSYSKGNANASLVITEFSDYQCPFCAKFTLEVLPQLQNDYIETGKILFVFKDYPIPNHKFAQKASEATYCAGEQNQDFFWKLHVKLFENQNKLEIEDILNYVDEMDINKNAFETCLRSDKYKNLVLRNKQEGVFADVTATPTLLIGNEKVIGLQPYENLAKIIETQLKK